METIDDPEIWRPVPSSYLEVSSLGRVKSHAWGKTRILKPYPNAAGYLAVSWKIAGKRFSRLLSHLVLEAFVGPQPPGKETRHLDGNHQNNRLGNLAWGTRWENQQDKLVHGTSGRKLTMGQVREIKEASASGVAGRKLARAYGVSHVTVIRILRGQHYNAADPSLLPQ
jgi:hypothetical protein